MLFIYSGLRVGEIAALTVADVATQNGDVRREIKLGAHQTKGSKGRTVILSERVRKELGSFQNDEFHKPIARFRSLRGRWGRNEARGDLIGRGCQNLSMFCARKGT